MALAKVVDLSQARQEKKGARQVLQDILEREGVEEVVVLVKGAGGKFYWDHSYIDSVFWWIGYLLHTAHQFSDYQLLGDD